MTQFNIEIDGKYSHKEFLQLSQLAKLTDEKRDRIDELKKLQQQLLEQNPFTEERFQRLKQKDSENSLKSRLGFLLSAYRRIHRRQKGQEYLRVKVYERLTLEEVEEEIGELLEKCEDDTKALSKEDRKRLSKLRKAANRLKHPPSEKPKKKPSPPQSQSKKRESEVEQDEDGGSDRED